MVVSHSNHIPNGCQEEQNGPYALMPVRPDAVKCCREEISDFTRKSHAYKGQPSLLHLDPEDVESTAW
jgi:hypothetical protein